MFYVLGNKELIRVGMVFVIVFYFNFEKKLVSASRDFWVLIMGRCKRFI